MLQKTELIECWSPCAKVTRPNASTGPSGLEAFETCLPYSTQYPGSSKLDSGVNLCAFRAAVAVTTLNVEPGVKRPAVARLRSGAAGWHGAQGALIRSKWFSTRFGS